MKHKKIQSPQKVIADKVLNWERQSRTFCFRKNVYIVKDTKKIHKIMFQRCQSRKLILTQVSY